MAKTALSANNPNPRFELAVVVSCEYELVEGTTQLFMTIFLTTKERKRIVIFFNPEVEVITVKPGDVLDLRVEDTIEGVTTYEDKVKGGLFYHSKTKEDYSPFIKFSSIEVFKLLML